MPAVGIERGEHELYRATTREVALVDVPAMRFVMVDGEGDPEQGEAFEDAVTALAAVAYGVGHLLAGSDRLISGISPLEALWWSEGPLHLDRDNADSWHWTVMVRQPDEVTAELIDEAVTLAQSRKHASPALRLVRFAPYAEGPAAQILHVGPLTGQGAALAELHAYMARHGYGSGGPHHEIYLTGRQTRPDRMRTIIRRPVAPRPGVMVDRCD